MKLSSKKIRTFLCTIICVSFILQSTALFSQIEDENITYQGWIDYNSTYHVNKKFKVFGDVGFRKISPNYWSRYYIRPAVRFVTSVGKKPGKQVTINYNLGLGFFFTNSVDTSNLIELRPFQGADVKWPNFKWLSINHYVRLEERFREFNRIWDVDLRLRYMLAANFHWRKENRDILNNFYIPFQVELFWHMLESDKQDNLLRLIAGVGYTFNVKWKLEFNFIYQRSRIMVDDIFETNDLIFRFRLYHTIF